VGLLRNGLKAGGGAESGRREGNVVWDGGGEWGGSMGRHGEEQSRGGGAVA